MNKCSAVLEQEVFVWNGMIVVLRVMIMVTNMMIMVTEMMRRELKPVFDQRELGEDGTALLPLDYSNSLLFNEPIIIGICICLCKSCSLHRSVHEFCDQAEANRNGTLFHKLLQNYHVTVESMQNEDRDFG